MIHLSPEQVCDILSDQFPALPLERVESIGEGGDNNSYEVNGSWIFRFPKTEQTAAKLQQEVTVLPAIAPALPLPVPEFDYIGRPGELYPFLFAGHRKLAGISGEKLRPQPEHWPAIARQMGEFLSCLHGFPAERLQGYNLPVVPLENSVLLLNRVAHYRSRIMAQLPEMVTPGIERFLSGQVPLPPEDSLAPVVSHADLKGEHVLVSQDGRSIAGLIDWTDISLADPSADFSGLMIWLGEAFIRQLLAHYRRPVDPAFLERVRFLTRCRTLINLGERLAGESDAPVELLLTQMDWAFSNYE